jgi:hypothetical protein
MNKNFVIAFISKDKDVILEPLAEFNGETMFFKTEQDAKVYVNRLLMQNGFEDLKPFERSEGLKIIRVQ